MFRKPNVKQYRKRPLFVQPTEQQQKIFKEIYDIWFRKFRAAAKILEFNSLPLALIMQCLKRLKPCSSEVHFSSHFTTLAQFLFRSENQSNPGEGDLHKNSGNVRWPVGHLLFTHYSLTIHYEPPLPEYSLAGAALDWCIYANLLIPLWEQRQHFIIPRSLLLLDSCSKTHRIYSAWFDSMISRIDVQNPDDSLASRSIFLKIFY